MKKFELSIPKPCHENWDIMTQQDKGRFCGSCQKTVVDFTNMSDRQMAEFFKKPAGSVCGRFHQDQLDREIEIPRKRIPWVNYFFTIALPAFLVSLKANSQKVTMGKPAIERVQLLGDTTTVVHPLKQKEKQQSQKTSSKNSHQRYKIEPIKHDGNLLTNSPCAIQPKQVLIKETSVYEPNRLVSIIVGGVGISRRVGTKKSASKEVTVAKNPDTAFSKFSVYPNPAKVNLPLTIDLKNIEAGDYMLSIINSDGSIVQSEKLGVEKKQRQTNFMLKDIPAGPYFIRLANSKTNKTYTEIIIVQ